jgi:uncharacterized protein
MYSRLLKPPAKSFFLFGPRGTGKTTWVKNAFPDAVYLDLLEAEMFNALLANPQRLESFVPAGHSGRIVIDEIQKVPALLDEVHRLIESRRWKFILTGSSPRKLRRQGTNLLAGRALTCAMHPLTAAESGKDFNLDSALRHGLLPAVGAEPDPGAYLRSYVRTYLEEEIRQEGLTRNMAAFARFLESASFSQGSLLNVSEVARDCGVERKVVEGYFGILDDLMIARRLPVFTRRSKRRLVAHAKFFFFDTGVFRTLRPAGPLDSPEEAEGPAFETLFLQNLLAINDALDLQYTVHYWRTATGLEVDFVLYGPRGLLAFELKRGDRVRPESLAGLKAFAEDYPKARRFLVNGGGRRMQFEGVEVWPMAETLPRLPELLSEPG